MQGLVHHIEIYVSDLETSKKFWTWLLVDHLKYSIYQQWDQGISYKFGETYLVFVQTEEKYQNIPYHRCGTGLNHLSFHADSRDFVDKVTEKLIAKDIKVLYKDRHPYAGGEYYYAVFFEDPDRIKVEIVAP